MAFLDLQKELEKKGREKFHFKINDNRSTMLSVKWEPDVTKVSLHKMFLSAPRNIMEELACYLKKEHSSISPHVREFIEQNLKKLDYSHKIDPNSLETRGVFYNLKHSYNCLNQNYFNNGLNLLITWFGKHGQKNKSKVTFGLYQDQLRLIKINRLMDSKDVPDYVLNFIIYHEMLHHVCPSYYDENGIHKIHSKEFKKREKNFQEYVLASQWLKINKNKFFCE